MTVGSGGRARKAGRGKGVGGEDAGSTGGGGTPAGHGIVSGLTSSSSDSSSFWQSGGAGGRSWASEVGDNSIAATAGVAGAAGERRTSSTVGDCLRVGAGNWGDEGATNAAGSRGGRGAEGNGSGGNEAGRGAGFWERSDCRYTPYIAVLNSCQPFGSSSASRVVDQVSHDSSSV